MPLERTGASEQRCEVGAVEMHALGFVDTDQTTQSGEKINDSSRFLLDASARDPVFPVEDARDAMPAFEERPLLATQLTVSLLQVAAVIGSIDNDSNKLFTIDTKLEGIKLFKQGQDMFLSVQTEDKILLWERIKSFWLEEGFQILSEDLTISSMRTNYLENLSEVQLGVIQRYVGRYVPLLVLPETRDSYKTRIVKKENGLKVIQKYINDEKRLGGIGEYIASEIMKKTDIECRVTTLGHVQRGAPPTANDRILASAFGVYAVDLLNQKKFDRMVAWRDRRVVDVPIDEGIKTYKSVERKDSLVETALSLGIYLGEDI